MVLPAMDESDHPIRPPQRDEPRSNRPGSDGGSGLPRLRWSCVAGFSCHGDESFVLELYRV